MLHKKQNIKYIIIFISILTIFSLYIINIKNKNNIVPKDNETLNSSAFLYNTTKNYNTDVTSVFIINKTNNDYSNIKSVFSSMGYNVLEGNFISYKNIKETNLLLFITNEQANKLKPDEISFIKNNIKNGEYLITEGNSKLAEELGIEFKNNYFSINSYIWNKHPDIEITLKDKIKVQQFNNKNSYKVLSNNNKSDNLSVVFNIDNGKIFYSSIPIVSSGQNGYENYPFFNEVVIEELGLVPSIEKNNLCIYADISYHINDKPKELAEKLSIWGVKQVNLSTWQIDEYPKFTESFIEECHKQGILVYGWVEYPMAGTNFWNTHPEWREKTADLKDAHIDWRYLMALEDDDCLKALKSKLKETLLNYDFDGVDIAEIYFESPGFGFENIKNFTPMHSSFRKKYKDEFGYDPIEIFEMSSEYYWKNNDTSYKNLIDYRCSLITSLHEEFLKLSKEIQKTKPYFDTSITVIDSISDDRMRENIGVDIQSIINLQKKFSFTLQIEDPYTLWTYGPQRYKIIGEQYKKLIDDNINLSIDINIIDRYGIIYPTKKQHGLEFMQLLYNASQYTDKVIMYAICTLNNYDAVYAKYAQRNSTLISKSKNDYYTDSTTKFLYNINKLTCYPIVDNKLWNALDNNKIIIPSGKHTISFSKIPINNKDIVISNINADDFDCYLSNKDVEITYNSASRCYITLINDFSLIKLDNEVVKPKIFKHSTNEFTIELPAGSHKINIIN